MKHIHILFLVINMIIGALVIYFTASLSQKSKNPVYKALILYLVSFNIFIFTDFSYKYLLHNIYGSRFSDFPIVPSVLLYFLVSAAETGIIYYLFKITASLKERPGSKTFIYALISLVAIYVIASVIGISVYLKDASSGLISVIHMAWIFSMLAIILITLSGLFLFSRQVQERERRRSLASFAVLTSIGFLMLAFSNLGFYFLDFNSGNLDPLIFFVINMSPVVWIRYFDTLPNYSINAAFPDSEKLITLKKDFNISEREAEIMSLIIEGKSNKEITDILNISSNTVKNHVYNIYRKLGVNSRSQMIRRIL